MNSNSDNDATLHATMQENSESTASSTSSIPIPVTSLLPFDKSFDSLSSQRIPAWTKSVLPPDAYATLEQCYNIEWVLASESNRQELSNRLAKMLKKYIGLSHRILSEDAQKFLKSLLKPFQECLGNKIQDRILPIIPDKVVDKIKQLSSYVSENALKSKGVELFTAIRESLQSYTIPKSVMPILLDGVVKYGGLLMIQCLQDPHTSDTKQYERSVTLAIVATLAADLAGGWKYCPDAIMLRGMFHFTRFQIAEAAVDFNAALKSKEKYKWVNPSHREICPNIIETLVRRDMTPCVGNFIEACANSELGDRYAAGQVQGIGKNSHKLFVFGGIRLVTKNIESDGDADEDAGDEFAKNYRENCENLNQSLGFTTHAFALNDLIAYDFLTESWQRLPVDGLSPPPRGHCRLGINRDDPDTLWMMGGSKETHGDSGFNDVWKYSFSSCKWTRVCAITNYEYSVSACDIYGDAIVNQKWYFVREELGGSGVTKVVAFDLKTYKWSTVKISGDSRGQPVFRGESCHWFYKSKLFIWGRENDDDLQAKLGLACNQSRAVVWMLNFDDRSNSCYWTVDIMIGDPASFKSCRKVGKINGQITTIYAESVAALDERTGKAFIFGGWNESFYTYAFRNHSEFLTLQGSYRSLLMEFDLEKKSIRAVEAATSSLGPGKRAKSVIGCYDSRVLIAGGYTTLNAKGDAFNVARTCPSEWMVMILPTKIVKEHARKEAATSASGSKSLNSPSPSLSPSTHSDTNSGPYTLSSFTCSPSDLLENAQRAVLADFNLRKLVSDMHPVGVAGAIMASVTNVIGGDSKPLALDKLFVKENMRFLALEDMNRYFPNLRNQYCYDNILMKNDPNHSVVVVYFFAMNAIECAVGKAILNSTPPPAKAKMFELAQFGLYGRWHPGAMYMNAGHVDHWSRDSKDNVFQAVKKGGINLSQSVTGVVQNPVESADLYKVGGIDESLEKIFRNTHEKCSCQNCPNISLYLIAALKSPNQDELTVAETVEENGPPPPKLRTRTIQ